MQNLQKHARRLMASLLGALLILTIVSGCGGGGGGGSADYTGVYRGQYSLTNAGTRFSGAMSMQVSSDGSAVAILIVDGSRTGAVGKVNLSNGNITISDSSGSFTVTISGKIRGNEASGSINSNGSVAGTFSMTKVSSGSSSLTAPSTQSSEADPSLSDALKKALKLN